MQRALFPLAVGGVLWALPLRAAAPALAGLSSRPLCFEANRGQADDSVRFVARTGNGVFQLSATAAVLTLRQAGPPTAEGPGGTLEWARNHNVPVSTLRFEFLAASPQARMTGREALPGPVNYFIGHGQADWRSVPAFDRVEVGDLYPGVKLVYYGTHQQLEYDFVVAAGAEPDLIGVRITGADQVQLDDQGDLILRVGSSRIRQHKPIVYQWDGGERRTIAGGYRLKDRQTVGFQIGAYNPQLPLIIDPVLSYSSFLGGLGGDTPRAVALDSHGNIYIAGDTLSAQLGTSSTVQPLYAGGYPGAGGDAFVAKFDPSGSNLLYLTYLGGNGDDGATSIAVDAEGNAYITGVTDSTNFPIAGLPISDRIGGPGEFIFGIHPYDAFVTKLAPDGSQLVYSTYLGGKYQDEGLAIAVDSSGCAYVAGFTESTNFPLVNPLQFAIAGNSDAFVAKLAANGSSLLYSTYLGGIADDHAESIAVDGFGRAYVTGYTTSTNFPVSASAFQTNRPIFNLPSQAFVSRLSPDGASLEQSTYLGGIGSAIGFHIALDGGGNAYVTGSEAGPGFPAPPGILNPGGIFKSVDGAANWTASSTGLAHNQVQAIGIDPVNPSNLYIGTGRGISRSTDGGATWHSSLDTFSQFLTFAVDPVTPSTIYAGSTNVLKSTDSGVSWVSSSRGLTTSTKHAATNQFQVGVVTKLVLDPVGTGTLYAGTLSGVFKSTDAAATWHTAGGGLHSLDVRDLIIDPLNPATLYAATSGGVFRSTDRGGGWTAFSEGLTNLVANALAINSASPSTLYVGMDDGNIFLRTEAGTNWILINTGLIPSNNVTVLATDPTTPATIYAGTREGLFKSVDAGTNWVIATNGLPALPIAALAISPASASTLYVGSFNAFGGTDAFLTKLSPNLDALVYSLVFGGDGTDAGMDVALDAAGNAFVAGSTTSLNFPTFQPAGYLGSVNSGANDAFVTVVNTNASAFLYSTYLGGSQDDFGLGIAVDAADNACIVGQTFSPDLPTVAPLQPAFHGPSDGFLARIQFTNSALVHITIQTAPAGVPMVVDGVTNNTPITFDWPSGSFHLLSGLPQTAGNGIQWAWTSWADVGTLSNRVVSFTNDATLTANFKTQYFLAMTATNLTVTAPDLQVEATNSGALSPGSGWYDPGTSVLIAAAPPVDDSFSGWLGSGPGSFSGPVNPVTVTLNGPVTETAAFTGPLTNVLTVVTHGEGSVSPNLNGRRLVAGNTYSLTARPGPGYVFSGWAGSIIAGAPRLRFVMTNGLALAASFIPSPFGPAQGTYAGLFFDTNSAVAASSGFFNATVTDLGKFSAQFRLGKTLYSWSGQFDSTGAVSGLVLHARASALLVALQLDLAGSGVMTGQIGAGTSTAELVANRPVFSTANPPPQAGRTYTLLMPGATDSVTRPAGDSFGTVTVAGSGNVRFAGTLADGAKVSQGTFLTAQGQWPFFAAPYAGGGAILGWLTFANRPADDLSGAVAWFKLPVPKGRLYPAGFTIASEAVGSLFSFTNGTPLVDFGPGSGRLVIENGKITPPFTNYIVLDTRNQVTSTNQVSLTLSTASGLFQGSVVDPVSRKTLSFNGALLQKQNRGGGYFLNDSQAGGVVLGP